MFVLHFTFSSTDFSDSDRLERCFDSEDEEFEILSLWRNYIFARHSETCDRAPQRKEGSERMDRMSLTAKASLAFGDRLNCFKHTTFLNGYTDGSVIINEL